MLQSRHWLVRRLLVHTLTDMLIGSNLVTTEETKATLVVTGSIRHYQIVSKSGKCTLTE